MRRSIAIGAGLALLVAGLPVLVSDAASGRSGRGDRVTLALTAPADILRSQRALERLGHLERGKYSAGELDAPTREALRDFQRDHSLRATGWLDWETFAMLPVDERPDQDDDGIPDAEDRCPSTPKRARVGHDGCPFAPERPKG